MAKEAQKPKLSTDAYKGVRDFFPVDMAIENKIFDIWRTISEKYGYEEYGASVLEPADLYRAKSGDEIVNEQTYTFTDRGDREVTLRPEMTPTVARMVAARKRELIFPLRWFSIPNLFRYEQPQRGRVREHWQLNVDVFGVESLAAEIEVINMAYDITRAYGLKDSEFEVRLNNRKLMNYVLGDLFDLDEIVTKKVSKLVDKKDKLQAEVFEKSLVELLDEKTEKFLTLLNSKNIDVFSTNILSVKSTQNTPCLDEIRTVIDGLVKLGINNVRFDPTLMRGFDYYTGIVFEVFDLNPTNRRSVFGGGRYDDLLALFGNEKVPAVGFGAGDVIARDLMETYRTLPSVQASADIGICVVEEKSSGEQNTSGRITDFALRVARDLRAKGNRVAVDLSGKKLGDQISKANKRGIGKVICIGDEEVKTGKYKIKDLKTGEKDTM